MDVLDGVPSHLLGHKIQTHTQIVVTCLIPACLELLAYLMQILADTAVAILLFRDKYYMFSAITTSLIVLPVIICFFIILTSPWQWPEEKGCGTENGKFFLRQLLNFIFFPIAALVRFSWRIFWSVDSLFYDSDTYDRQYSIGKALQTSPFELYLFIQAYVQAAPQTILQMYILLSDTIFRNYETVSMQVLSIIFSLINIAVITTSFQRFESQKSVGRNYPWSTNENIQQRSKKFQLNRKHTEEIRQSRKTNISSVTEFPESEHILRRFHSQHHNPSKRGSDNSSFIEPKDEGGPSNFNYNKNKVISRNITDDDKLNYYQIVFGSEGSGIDTIDTDQSTGIQLRKSGSSTRSKNQPTNEANIEDMNFDNVPSIPAPLPPDERPTSKHLYLNPLNRLSTFTDKMLLKTEIYIKDHIPHPPSIILERSHRREEKEGLNKNIRHNVISVDSRASAEGSPRPTISKKDITDVDAYAPSTSKGRPEVTGVVDGDGNGAGDDGNGRNSAAAADSVACCDNLAVDDEVDIFLPSRRKMIEGVEQDDFIGKLVSFFGWIMFILMRMLSLSVFSVFYPWEFVYIVCAHYALMLLCLIYETRFHEKIQRILFYIFLGYIYIFVLLEFKIKFKRIRLWYIGYFLLVILENFIMTLIWYTEEDYESWWFGYLFTVIIVSGLLNILCMFVYYVVLRPDDVILFEDENSSR